MSDISIPGLTEGRYNTEKIIDTLLKAKEVKLKSLEKKGLEFEKKERLWQEINFLSNQLETSSLKLYGSESPFRSKEAWSSDESIVQVTGDRRAELMDYKLSVLQLAKAQRLISDELDSDLDLPAGQYTFALGSEERSFSFRGGPLQDFVSLANRQLGDVIQFQLIDSYGSNQVLSVSSLRPGRQNQIVFKDSALDFGLRTGLIKDGSEFNKDLLQSDWATPSVGSDDSVDPEERAILIKPLQELVIDFPASYPVLEGSELVYRIEALDAEERQESREGQNPNETNPKKTSSLNRLLDPLDPLQAGRGDDLPPPPGAALEEVRVESVGGSAVLGSLSRELGAPPEPAGERPEEPASGAGQADWGPQTAEESFAGNASVQFQFLQGGLRVAAPAAEVGPQPREVRVSLEGIDNLRELEGLAIQNTNNDQAVRILELRLENQNVVEGYLAANQVAPAQNARISYMGVDLERESNTIDDLFPGVELQLNQAAPGREIEVGVKPDYEIIIENIIQFINDYNLLMTKLNIVSTNNKIVIEEKVSFSVEEKKQAETELGALISDNNLKRFKYQLSEIPLEAYPTLRGRSMLSDFGIGTHLSGNSFEGENSFNPSRFRGYLEFDTEIMFNALQRDFKMVQDLFGRDNDGDYIVDSGSAFEMQRLTRNYTQINGVFLSQIQSLGQDIEKNQERIEDYQKYLEKYEAELRTKYGKMTDDLNKIEQSQRRLENAFQNGRK